MKAQPVKRVLCKGYEPNSQCLKCARKTDKPVPDPLIFLPPDFVNGKCPMRVQK